MRGKLNKGESKLVLKYQRGFGKSAQKTHAFLHANKLKYFYLLEKCYKDINISLL